MRYTLIYSLLLSFTVLFTPKSIWHSHDVVKKTNTKDSHSAHFKFEEDCFICDFTLQPAINPIHFKFHFPKNNNFIAPINKVTSLAKEFILAYSHRGPPVSCDLFV